MVRDETGAWVPPGAKSFQGVAKILNKEAKLVNLLPHPWQLELDDLLEGQRAAGQPMRAIVLKARKLGFSTWVAMKFLQRVTQIEYQHAVVVAQDITTAGAILEMAKRTYAHLPTIEQLGLGFNIRPPIIGERGSHSARKFLEFGEASERVRRGGRTGSSIFEVDTAGAPDSGRGTSPTMLHLSEVAWYEGNQATRKMLGMLNAVAYSPETIVILESTANGLNHFHRRWVSAKEGAGDETKGESYAALFVAWHRDPNCRAVFATEDARQRFMETIGDEKGQGDIAEQEPMLQEMYGCTPEQLLWRRRQIREQHESSVELFDQENPHSDTAAFIGSGRTVYSTTLVARAIKAAERAPEPATGSLKTTATLERKTRGGSLIVPTAAVWVPSSEMQSDMHRLEVWEHPVLKGEKDPEDGAYVVAADVAHGERNTFTKGDYHVIQVFNHRTREQVAIHESRMDIHELPLWVLQIALYYNNAWLAPEVNDAGIVVVEALQKDYRYGRMYRRKRYGAMRDDMEDKPGWKTDAQSKPVMEATFGQALRDEIHGLRDLRTAKQLSTYIINEKGKHEAQSGEHDDRLIAAMIAWQVMEVLRPPKAGKRKPKPYEPSDPLVGY